VDKERHPFVHLIDGGIADNIGLRFIERSDKVFGVPLAAAQ